MNDGQAKRANGRLTAAVVVGALAVMASVGVPAAQLVDRVIAVVSGTVILLSDARAVLALGLVDAGGAKDPVEVAMRWLIDRQLVLDEAGRGDRVEVDPAAVAQAVAGAKQRFSSEAEYRRALEGLGLDDAGVQRLFRDTLAARQYGERRFDSVLPATEEEMREYYTAHESRFVRNGRPLTFEDAQAELAAMLQQERRTQAMASWMDRLRRRADIREVYQASR
jgi:parvulin-like peptidyl-prolyl isomerase